MSRLNGKVALVTGAAKGIGAGIARRLASDGARVVVNYASSESQAQAVVDDIARDGGRAIAVRADVRQQGDVDALVRSAIERFGRLDIPPLSPPAKCILFSGGGLVPVCLSPPRAGRVCFVTWDDNRCLARCFALERGQQQIR